MKARAKMSFKLFVLLISLAIVVANDLYSSSSESDEIGEVLVINTYSDIDEFLGLHPGVHVEKMDQSFGDVRGSLFYTLGARVHGNYSYQKCSIFRCTNVIRKHC